jgi:glycosyltransferase involved in cell wall biosynthesis
MRRTGSCTESDWALGVVVPARNEEASIGECVASILRAVAAHPAPHDSWIVIVADSCSDQTAARARELLGSRGTVLESAVGSPGVARRLGVEAVLQHFARCRMNKVWIANTDADSSPSSDWITCQLSLASQGYCAVAGIVRVDSVADLPPEIVRQLLSDYTIDADGSHPHVHELWYSG